MSFAVMLCAIFRLLAKQVSSRQISVSPVQMFEPEI